MPATHPPISQTVTGAIVVALVVAAGLGYLYGATAASPVLIAAATVYASWRATHEAHRLERKRRDEATVRETAALLRALRTEIGVTWDRYEEAIGQLVKAHPSDQPYNLFFRANREYLHVYRASAGRLGEIEDDDLRDAIERAYIYLTVLLEQHDMAHEGNNVLSTRVLQGLITREESQILSTSLTQSVQAARDDAERYVQAAKAKLDAALA